MGCCQFVFWNSKPQCNSWELKQSCARMRPRKATQFASASNFLGFENAKALDTDAVRCDYELYASQWQNWRAA